MDGFSRQNHFKFLCNYLRNNKMTIIIVLYTLTTVMSYSVAMPTKHHSRKLREGKSSKRAENARLRRSGLLNQHNDPFRLINTQQGQYLELREDGSVKGTTDENSYFTVLKLISVDVGVVALMGVNSGRYLCINKKGKVMGIKVGKKIKDDCKLLERMPDGHSFTFHREKRKKRFYLIIDRNGKAKKALKLRQPTSLTYFAKKTLDPSTMHIVRKVKRKKKKRKRKKHRT